MGNAKLIQTTPYDYEGEANRNRLLQRMKEQFHTDFMPSTKLYEMTSLRGNDLPKPRLFWLSGSAMTGSSFSDVTDEQNKAAHTLLEKGYLMRTFSSVSSGGAKVRHIQLLEDAQWGIDDQDNMHIFELASPDSTRDDVLKLGEEYAASIDEMNRRIEHGAAFIHSSKIKLSDGTSLSPIIHDRKAAALFSRQLTFQT